MQECRTSTARLPSSGVMILLAYVFLAIALFESNGHYTHRSLWLAIISFALIASTIFFIIAKRIKVEPPSITITSITLLFLLYISLSKDPGIYIKNPQFIQHWRTIILFIGMGILFTYTIPFFQKRSLRRCAFFTIGITAILLRLWILQASPKPKIDVFDVNQQYSQILLLGKNPYSTPIDIKNTANNTPLKLQGYDYLPGNLLLTTLGYFLNGDSRTIFIIAEIIAMFLLYSLVKSTTSEQFAEVLTLLFLFHPRSLFVIEQAWLEPLMLPFFAFFLLQFQRGRFRSAAMAYGYFLSLKQYLLFFPVHLLLLTKSPRFFIRVFIVVFLLVEIFAIWDPVSFWNNGVMFVLNTPFRIDTLTVPAALSRLYDITTPKVWNLILGASMSISMLMICKRLRPIVGFLFASTLTTFSIFLFGTQGFCNYYYFVSFLILCLLGLHAERSPEQTEIKA